MTYFLACLLILAAALLALPAVTGTLLAALWRALKMGGRDR